MCLTLLQINCYIYIGLPGECNATRLLHLNNILLLLNVSFFNFVFLVTESSESVFRSVARVFDPLSSNCNRDCKLSHTSLIFFRENQMCCFCFIRYCGKTIYTKYLASKSCMHINSSPVRLPTTQPRFCATDSWICVKIKIVHNVCSFVEKHKALATTSRNVNEMQIAHFDNVTSELHSTIFNKL